jgi:hypothetical protein
MLVKFAVNFLQIDTLSSSLLEYFSLMHYKLTKQL